MSSLFASALEQVFVVDESNCLELTSAEWEARDIYRRFTEYVLNPLRPLRHILWSWVEDEVARLTVRRRAAEYEFEYGLPLIGRAVPNPRIFVSQ